MLKAKSINQDMENQVLSISQKQELVALNIIDEDYGSMYWHNYNTDEDPQYEICSTPDVGDISTLTLQDILNILPKKVIDKLTNVPTGLVLIRSMEQDWWKISYQFEDIDEFIQATPTFKGNNPLEPAFNLLKWCKENGYL